RLGARRRPLRGRADARRVARPGRRARDRADRADHRRERLADAAAAARARRRPRGRRLRAPAPSSRARPLPRRLRRGRRRDAVPSAPARAAPVRARVGARRPAAHALPAPRRARRARPRRAVSDTLVFIPAWNEEDNLPAVLDALRERLPEVDVLVVDDGSTDGTAEVAREHGAEVLSHGVNRGLQVGIANGYRYALEHGYAYCGRVAADGQHPPEELARLLDRVRSDGCDVAVGSRFVSGDGYAAYRYRPSAPRRLGTAVLRRSMGLVLDRPFGD